MAAVPAVSVNGMKVGTVPQAYLESKPVKDTRVLISDLCRQFYNLGWVSGTGGSITIKVHDDSIPKPHQLILMYILAQVCLCFNFVRLIFWEYVVQALYTRVLLDFIWFQFGTCYSSFQLGVCVFFWLFDFWVFVVYAWLCVCLFF